MSSNTGGKARTALTYFPFPDHTGAAGAYAYIACFGLNAKATFPCPATGSWRNSLTGNRKAYELWLLLVDMGHSVGATVYIEQVLDYTLLACCNGELKRIYSYRLWIPMTRLMASAFVANVAVHLATDTGAEPVDRRAPKRARIASPPPVVDVGPKPSSIRHSSQFCSAWAAAKGGTFDASFSEVDFDRPTVQGGETNTGELVDSDDEREEGAAEDPTLSVTAGLPPNNPLCMFDAKDYFVTLNSGNWDGVHDDQIHAERYMVDGYFEFPEMVTDNDLVWKLKPNCPCLEGLGAMGLMNHHLPGVEVPKEVLIAAIETMRDNAGTRVPEGLATMDRPQLMVELFLQSTSGTGEQIDPTIAQPLVVPPRTPKQTINQSSREVLDKMWIVQAEFESMYTNERACLQKAYRAGTVDPDIVREWTKYTAKQIKTIFKGEPKWGMPPAPFTVGQECDAIRRSYATDCNVVGSTAHIASQMLNNAVKVGAVQMDPFSEMMARMCNALRNPLHMMAAQTSVIILGYAATFLTYLPEIHEQQLFICLLGGSDKGKSALMKLLSSMLPMTSRALEDTASAKAVTQHGCWGVKFLDEIKHLTTDCKKSDATQMLSAISNGFHVHRRMVLVQDGGESYTETIYADHRCVTFGSSNGEPWENCKSRFILIYMAGATEPHGQRSRVEMAGFCNNNRGYTGPIFACKVMWAQHMPCWQLNTMLRWYVCKSYDAAFTGLYMKIMDKHYPLQPRQIVQLRQIAYGFMMWRVSYECNRQTDLTELEYYMANSLVQMKDLCLAMTSLLPNIETMAEDAIVLATLKSEICFAPCKKDLGEIGKLITDDANRYYITNLKSVGDICARAGALSQSENIITIIVRKLSNTPGIPILKTLDDANYRGHYAVLKTAVDDGEIFSRDEQAIITFLKHDIIGSDTKGNKMWLVGYNENEVVFTKAVLHRFLHPYSTTAILPDSPTLRGNHGNVPEFERALMQLEASGVVSYREHLDQYGKPSTHPHTKVQRGTHWVPAAIEHAVRVDRAGLLDDARMFGLQYDETHDEDITEEMIAEWKASMALSSPSTSTAKEQDRAHWRAHSPAVPRGWKTIIPITGGMSIHSKYVVGAINARLHDKYGYVANTEPDDDWNQEECNDAVLKARAMRTMLNACMQFSGERQPGEVFVSGAPPGEVAAYTTHTVAELDEEIVFYNPRRYSAKAMTDMEPELAHKDNLDDVVCPKTSETLTVPGKGESTMTNDLLVAGREINLVV